MAARASRPRRGKIVERVLIGSSLVVLFVGSIAAWAVNNPLGKGDERGTSDILYIPHSSAASTT